MRQVCGGCGMQLSIDRDIDDDRVFAAVVQRHKLRECSDDIGAGIPGPQYERTRGMEYREQQGD